MSRASMSAIDRRQFLSSACGSAAVAGLALVASRGHASEGGKVLHAGEGVADITPPLGIEMGGFHRPPGSERRIKGVRQPCAVRALVLEMGDTRVAVCSLDLAAVGQEMASRIRQQASQRTGIPAENIRVCATHSHSMPGFCYMRQWGAIPVEFMATVEKRTVEAIERAKADIAPAEVSLGKARAVGGNHNRTTKTFKTDEKFGKDSTDDERWLDTSLHALLFHRAGKRTLLWYHFSAHAVCYADEIAGPDWPGAVAQLVRENEKLDASFLQGHIGDVNPGDGKDWRGEINQSVKAIYPALRQAISSAAPVKIDTLRTSRQEFNVPLDMALFKSWREQYEKEPAKCTGGAWVDAGFAADWYKGNAKRELSQAHLGTTLSGLRLGSIGLLFHPAELYSVYGLVIRRDSSLTDTLVVGYTDGIIGYLPDPNAYKAGEYSAVVVPKILDYPPFTPTAAREATKAAVGLMRGLT